MDVTRSLLKLLLGYEPRGDVETMDVFTARKSGVLPQKEWVENHVSKWKGFTRTGMMMHECEGSHIDLLTTEHIVSFQSVLKAVLRGRGI